MTSAHFIQFTVTHVAREIVQTLTYIHVYIRIQIHIYHVVSLLGVILVQQYIKNKREPAATFQVKSW